MTETVTRRCSWCQTAMGTKEMPKDRFAGEETHGICGPCLVSLAGLEIGAAVMDRNGMAGVVVEFRYHEARVSVVVRLADGPVVGRDLFELTPNGHTGERSVPSVRPAGMMSRTEFPNGLREPIQVTDRSSQFSEVGCE